MTFALNLITNEEGKIEKRVLPRFPLNYLTFKLSDDASKGLNTFSVVDISETGAQLERKLGTIENKVGDKIQGNFRWHGHECNIAAEVMWVQDSRLGIRFDQSKESEAKIQNFLNISNFIANLRPLHSDKYNIKTPVGLKYWLQAEGPVEVFVWTDQSDAMTKFQIVLFKNVIEWTEKQVRSGEVISKRNVESPLFDNEEIAFRFDNDLNDIQLQKARNFLDKLNNQLIDSEFLDLMKRSLR